MHIFHSKTSLVLCLFLVVFARSRLVHNIKLIHVINKILLETTGHTYVCIIMYMYHYLFASLKMSYINVVDINFMYPILLLFVSNIHSTKFESDHQHSTPIM